jgi:hypothetical protein
MFPFLANKKERTTLRGRFDGIIGLSPIDDSSGPLFVDYLYK